MALNKRKVLDSARKLAQKGAKAKALKEYQLLLQADPRDAKLLLEVGDCYRRWGQIEDAIAQYAKVAQQYRQDGFDARAVAVYKQILNLDPKHHSAYVSLSELYQRMGLDAEAIGALQTAADGYHREGRKTEALELLRQMAALDPTNVTSRLKVAELLRQEKMTAEALAEYEAAARELEGQQEREQLLSVRERILELDPDHLSALTGMARSLMVAGQLDRAEPFALRGVEVGGDPVQYELLIELYAQMGNDARLAEATRGLAKVHRDRGDEDKARELMQRLPTDEVGARSRLAVDVSEVDEPEIADEELLDGDPFLTVPGKRATGGPAFEADELELDEEDDEIQLDTPAQASTASAPPLEGDPDQLLAEASVYLRYGKRAQAIASLRAILDQDPDHRAALEKLGEAYVDEGQPAQAVAVWMKAAEQIRGAGDAKALGVLRDRIAAIDAKAAAALGPVKPASKPAPEASAPVAAKAPARATAPPAAPDATEELDLDLEVELDEVLADAAAELAGPPTDAASTQRPALEDEGFEFEVDASGLELAEESVEDESVPVPEETSSSGLSLAEDGSFEFEIDPDAITGDELDDADGPLADASESLSLESASAGVDPNAQSAQPGSTTTMARLQEELEEAEFYVAQQMFDEAESILTRILQLAPNHPGAMLRMGEIEAARGGAPQAAAHAPARTRAGRAVAGTSELDLGSTTRFEDGIDLSDPGELPGAEEGGDSGSGIELDMDGPIDVEIDVEAEGELDVEATVPDGLAFAERDPDEAPEDEDEEVEVDASETATARVPERVEPIGTVVLPRPQPKRVTPPPTVIPAPPAPSATTPAPAMQAAANAVAAAPASTASVADDRSIEPGETFDLREALADVFNDPGESARGRVASEALSTVADGFESIFSDFKKGVSATLGEGDYDTRYDLGIAYREMGLFEDAIGEFKICLESPRRRFDSLFLMGLCARDLGRHVDAVHHLEQALALPDLPEDRLAGVFFELAIAQSLAGDAERARANMRRVLELDPRFPNAAAKLAELESPSGSAGDGGGSQGADAGGFESFDDLFADESDADEAEPGPPVESFESFDDVVSDVEVEPPVSAAVRAREPSARGARDASSARPAAPETTGDANGESARKGPRKKISFV